jgi:hypothetical protein
MLANNINVSTIKYIFFLTLKLQSALFYTSNCFRYLFKIKKTKNLLSLLIYIAS